MLQQGEAEGGAGHGVDAVEDLAQLGILLVQEAAHADVVHALTREAEGQPRCRLAGQLAHGEDSLRLQRGQIEPPLHHGLGSLQARSEGRLVVGGDGQALWLFPGTGVEPGGGVALEGLAQSGGHGSGAVRSAEEDIPQGFIGHGR